MGEGEEEEISIYKFSQRRLPGLLGFNVAAFSCGCQLSSLQSQHTWTRCYLYAFPAPTLKLFITMKLGDHLVQETLLCRVPEFSCESKLLKRSIGEAKSFLISC